MPSRKSPANPKTASRRKSLTLSPATASEVTAFEVDYLSTAAESISTAAGTLRAMAATFSHDGHPQAEVSDVSAGVRVGIAHLRAASDALFSINPGEWSHDRANPLLVSMWDAADIVIVVGFALATDKFPDGAGMTVCPIQGALKIAVKQLLRIGAGVAELRDSCSEALQKDVKRLNREFQRQEARP